ncbi:unnamed protein product [Euphydryas editha]|uniref:Regulatory protein zeste n=1 Tax=Euphydryas editha TaxID=104508 RepID=A0AAU9UR95_EUPED|nr:unnamed protein product [Euphydryas editha]
MSKQKINAAQKHKLLDLLSSKPQLRSGKFSITFSHKDAQKEWEEIARVLNAIPGANKDWKAWRKTWQDYMSRTKIKSAAINKVRSSTGGGPPPPNPLDQFEEGVAALLHPYAVGGHTASSESSVLFDFTDEVILPPPIDYAGDSEAGDDGETAVSTEIQPPPTGTQPPLTNNKQKRKKKINMKTLLEEKVKLKKDLFEEKKKFYKGFISNMERQTKALEDISRVVMNINNTDSQHTSGCNI